MRRNRRIPKTRINTHARCQTKIQYLRMTRVRHIDIRRFQIAMHNPRLMRRIESLRDPDKNEIALIRDPTELDPESRAVLNDALASAGFAFQVVGIHDVEEEVEIRRWDVSTEQGRRTFQTSRDTWPRELSAGGYVIRDVAGDLYHIGSPDALDESSRKLLWAFVE